MWKTNIYRVQNTPLPHTKTNINFRNDINILQMEKLALKHELKADAVVSGKC